MLVYLISAVLVFVFYVKWKLSYWKRAGVFQFDPEFLFGDFRKELLGKASLFEGFREKYRQLKARNHKHGGVYLMMNPVYMPVDLDIIKRIVIKDFPYFLGHAQNFHPKDNLTMNVFAIFGDPWRKLRTKLTPTFTSGKMKLMFDTLVGKTTGLETLVRSHIKNNKALDIKEVIARFTTDIIASCAFGIESNCLDEAENEFRKYGKKVFEPTTWRVFIVNGLPKFLVDICFNLGFKVFPKDINQFFTKTVQDTIRYRKESKVIRKDFMHLLLQMKDQKNKSDSITEDEIIAQCFIFFAAGYETSSTTTTFALLELSQDQEIQDKLRAEIKDVLERHDGKITYDAVMEMTYLEMVLNETLRKYPPVPVIPRLCTKDYHVPDTDVVIKKGTNVRIPVWGIQTDPEYFPNPDKFNPENFNAENKTKIHEMAFIPFGEGPRMCIGLRFGKLQSKVALVSLLRNFRFTLGDKTQTPIKFKKISVVLSVEGDVWLNANEL
ncbi:probable cytochrome P450 6a14 [Sitophilus oryzae]|uniref:Probable cytochrome P450 6a14 n=1 Tax=Sitophilus oryzae TaxID=7048 RepID=A0A6J2XTZ0_SITOR|nr:probable cytochrome P450 6a14 [Sitophilus oryzae]